MARVKMTNDSLINLDMGEYVLTNGNYVNKLSKKIHGKGKGCKLLYIVIPQFSTLATIHLTPKKKAYLIEAFVGVSGFNFVKCFYPNEWEIILND